MLLISNISLYFKYRNLSDEIASISKKLAFLIGNKKEERYIPQRAGILKSPERSHTKDEY